MTPQPQLFYEDVFEVAKAAVQAAGGTKQVAHALWPNIHSVAEAQRKLSDCLNRDRPEKLCIEEFMALLLMAREAGFHQAKHWIDTALGYQPTPPADPKIERERLADEFARLRAAVENATRTMERLTVEPGVRAVK
jgi:hypothetical protein